MIRRVNVTMVRTRRRIQAHGNSRMIYSSNDDLAHRDFECLRRHVHDRRKRSAGRSLAIPAVAIKHRDRFGGAFVADRTASTPASKRSRDRFFCHRSINVEIVPGNDFSFVILMHFFQQLLFASCLAAILSARLVATRVGAMVKDQQPGLRFARDFSKLL